MILSLYPYYQQNVEQLHYYIQQHSYCRCCVTHNNTRNDFLLLSDQSKRLNTRVCSLGDYFHYR